MLSSDALSSLFYDGSTCPIKFVRNFELTAIMQDWDEAKQLAHLPKFLKGKAERVFKALDEGGERNTIANALKNLQLKCAQTKEVLLTQFFARKRLPNESISGFAIALQELLNKAIPNMQAPERDLLLRNQLCTGLTSELCALVQFNATMEWDTMISCLDKTFMHASVGGVTPQQPPYSSPVSTSVKNEPVDLNWTNATRNNAGQSSRASNATGRARFNGTCFYCKIVGHKESDCRKKKNETKSSSSSSNGASNYMSNNRSYNNKFQKANANPVDVNDKHVQFEDESFANFPFFADNNVMQASFQAAKLQALMKIKVQLILFGQSTQLVTALIDGGSSHSFISPTVLTPTQMKIASNKDDKTWCVRKNYVITGATGAAKTCCAITTAELKIENWAGKHEFIISGEVRRHEMILGRDFLKKYEVKIDHASDTLDIGSNKIYVNTIRSELDETEAEYGFELANDETDQTSTLKSLLEAQKQMNEALQEQMNELRAKMEASVLNKSKETNDKTNSSKACNSEQNEQI